MIPRVTANRIQGPRNAGRAVVWALYSLAIWTLPAAALEQSDAEMAALKACEKQICTMILGKQPKGADLACGVQKTWAKSSLEEGNSKGVSWGFGDARCSVDLKLSRAEVVNALTKPKHKVFVPAHDVKCVIERDGVLQPVTARLAPKLVFKNGKADKVWINLEDIDGPADVKSTISAAAKLEDSIGIFHGPMIKQINKFMHQQCAKRYGPGAVAQDPAKKKADAAKKLAAKKSADPAAVKPAPAAASAAGTAPTAAKPPAAPTKPTAGAAPKAP
jgi:hypothetical protein